MTNKYITDMEMVIVQRVAYNKKGFYAEFMNWTDVQQELYVILLKKYNKILEYREDPEGYGKLTKLLNNEADRLIREEWIKFFPNLSSLIKTEQMRQIIKNNWNNIESYKLKNPKTKDILYKYYHEDINIMQLSKHFNISRPPIYRHIEQFEQDYLFKNFDRNEGKIDISQIKINEQGEKYA